MGALLYRVGRATGQFVFIQTLRVEVLRRSAAERPEPFLLAPTHVSNLEPFILSVILRRKVDWMARIEMFGNPLARAFMRLADAFPVNRQRPGHSSIRTAIHRLGRGRCVGIFPEGGVAQGANSVMRGGAFKQGVCSVSLYTGMPILPCVVIGSEKLNHVGPWLPFRRGRLWIAFGDRMIHPPKIVTTRREARRQLAVELGAEYQRLYAQTLETYNLDDSIVP